MEWIRNPAVEDVYKEMHKIKPEVYYNRIDDNCYQVKIKKDGKEFIITEHLKNGLPESVTLEHNGEVKECKRVYNAELEINKMLEVKDGSNFF